MNDQNKNKAQLIDELEQARKAIATLSERLKGFDLHSTEGVYRVDITTPAPIDLPHAELVDWINRHAIVREVNNSMAQMYGLTPKEMLGRPAIEFAPNYGERAALVLDNEDCRVINEETKNLDHQGELLYLRENYHGIIEDGLLVSIWGAQSDITERKRSEGELQKLAAAIKHSGELVNLATLDGKMVFLNEAGGRILGIDPQQIENVNIMEVIPDHLMGMVESELIPTLKKGEMWEGDLQYKNLQTGRLTDVHAMTFTVNDPVTNEPQYLANVSLDITERKRAEEEKAHLEAQYQQAQKVESIGRLAGGVAHDLNNLLSPIIGYGEILLEDLDEDDTRRRFVDAMLSAGFKARDLVRQLLAFSRKQTLEYQPVDLNKAVLEFKRLLQRTIREDIVIEITPSPDIPVVLADIRQIEQVILNLAVNAADAMPKGGQLKIETSLAQLDEEYAAAHQGINPGDYVMLQVSDTGTGIDPKIKEHLFEPFFTTKGEHGTGLGLATVYGIVKQHRGSIWVYSEPDEGAVFKVYLPLAKKLPEHMRLPSSPDLTGDETILLVEDDDQVRQMTYDILCRQGYRVLVAENGPRALFLLASFDEPLHLLLTDVVMPEMNGKELYHQVVKKYPAVKVVYMSGYNDNVIANRGVLDSGVAFLQKPFTIQPLAKKIREVLDGG